ncbi:alpha-ketoglutarate-dependent dioxygenase AlkB [Yinghuangia sp. ASG 101]|uniref:alpha-ketoglutarate-dependent dioxygenase AlkB n=1 Tax=Yinghuangia sp. ASG 101 TaxID=2896848 RepID=UPI001E34DA0C|nr:alpha-ketoglutarate-dependent dioxygenase AlkB [Yinghuangia sp. ASG 101]UGQ14011.1 alpha-ketoglutarate-dependent dioxygenase AlkB [Yinghuangia sp. ASG 101]
MPGTETGLTHRTIGLRVTAVASPYPRARFRAEEAPGPTCGDDATHAGYCAVVSEISGRPVFDDDVVPPAQVPGTVPGLRCVAGWLGPGVGEALLAEIDAAPWSTRLKRRVQHYGHRYDYGSRKVAADPETAVPPLPEWAREAATRLVREGLMDREAEQVIVNEYQPGQGISAHVDCLPCFGPVVAAISLGSRCVMDFSDPESGTKLAMPLAPGSLLVMTGPARFTWRHGIAARKSDPGTSGRVPRGRRVSVTFRTMTRPGPGS